MVVFLFAKVVTGILLGVGREGVEQRSGNYEASGKMTEMGLQVGDSVRFCES